MSEKDNLIPENNDGKKDKKKGFGNWNLPILIFAGVALTAVIIVTVSIFVKNSEAARKYAEGTSKTAQMTEGSSDTSADGQASDTKEAGGDEKNSSAQEADSTGNGTDSAASDSEANSADAAGESDAGNSDEQVTTASQREEGNGDENGQTSTGKEATTDSGMDSGASSNTGLLDDHGKLAVKGTKLVDADGNPFQLKGVSTMGLQWYPQYVNYEAFKTLRDDWGANLIRLAMYTYEGGYCDGGDKTSLEKTIENGVNYAKDLGMYVIIDWHVLNEQTPLRYLDEAKTFWNKTSAKYDDYSNVIYEICNEPNNTSWSDIKKYVDTIVPIIRKNDPDAVILVGTDTWSQMWQMSDMLKNPLSCDTTNLMYVCHFYAATHKDDLRNNVKNAISNGLPVFISEFSICDASGNGGIDYDSAKAWKELINSYNLSYAGWSLCNKDETSALIKASCDKLSGWSEAELSDTGKWLRQMISEGYNGKYVEVTTEATSEEKEDKSIAASEAGDDGAVTSGDYTVTLEMTDHWREGSSYCYKLEGYVTNNSKSTLSDWSKKIKASSSVTVSTSWGCKGKVSGSNLTISGDDYTLNMGAGQQSNYGLIIFSDTEIDF